MVKGRVSSDTDDGSTVSGNGASNSSSAADSINNSVRGVKNSDYVIEGNDNRTESKPDNNSDSVSYVEIDPSELGEYIATDGGDNTPRKRRGRKPGSKNVNSGKKKAEETVKPFLIMAHQMMATFLKVPELVIEEEEAKKLSDAYTVFCEHHDVPVLSDKRLSEINLIVAVGMVYVPRVIAIKNRVVEEKRASKAKNVTQPIQQHPYPINMAN